jgi:serine/threonine-protein kinase RIM15
VITYEFLYGVPPFNADTPAKVFDNIISRRIDWHEDWVDFSPEARDFMERLMTTDPKQRLGYNGAQEVKNHPFLRGVEWDKVATTEAQFVPQVSDPESTDYFDPRGAIPQLFDEEPIAITGRIVTDSPKDDSAFATKGTPSPITKEMKEKEKEEDVPANDDFGSFAFKNLPVLKQANDDVIRKLRSDQLSAIGQALAEPAVILDRRRSLSQKVKQGQSIHIPLENRVSHNFNSAFSLISHASHRIFLRIRPHPLHPLLLLVLLPAQIFPLLCLRITPGI